MTRGCSADDPLGPWRDVCCAASSLCPNDQLALSQFGPPQVAVAGRALPYPPTLAGETHRRSCLSERRECQATRPLRGGLYLLPLASSTQGRPAPSSAVRSPLPSHHRLPLGRPSLASRPLATCCPPPFLACHTRRPRRIACLDGLPVRAPPTCHRAPFGVHGRSALSLFIAPDRQAYVCARGRTPTQQRRMYGPL